MRGQTGLEIEKMRPLLVCKTNKLVHSPSPTRWIVMISKAIGCYVSLEFSGHRSMSLQQAHWIPYLIDALRQAKIKWPGFAITAAPFSPPWVYQTPCR